MKIETLTRESLADVLAKMDIQSAEDLGSVLIHTGLHPEHGECATVDHWQKDMAVLIKSKPR